MAATSHMSRRASPTSALALPEHRRVILLRFVMIGGIVALWETIAASGLLFQDVVPSLAVIGRAMLYVLFFPDFPLTIGGTSIWIPEFYRHLWVTMSEVGGAMALGGLAGLGVGLLLGTNPFFAGAFERVLYYLGPTPKIIFFPLMIMWFGVGSGSKVAMGAISCFFPVALSAAAGVRQVEAVLVRVGVSFRLNAWQMITKIYLPAMREPVINGIRLGLGVAMIGTLLAETKLSNRGVGFLIINAYSTFDMPRMYALIAVLFVIAIAANAWVGRARTAMSIRR